MNSTRVAKKQESYADRALKKKSLSISTLNDREYGTAQYNKNRPNCD
jgi:hypothetical protein